MNRTVMSLCRGECVFNSLDLLFLRTTNATHAVCDTHDDGVCFVSSVDRNRNNISMLPVIKIHETLGYKCRVPTLAIDSLRTLRAHLDWCSNENKPSKLNEESFADPFVFRNKRGWGTHCRPIRRILKQF